MRTGIGAALPRVDGRLKVTGAARYAAEHPAEGLLYGVVVSSSIAKGRIASIDARRRTPCLASSMSSRTRIGRVLRSAAAAMPTDRTGRQPAAAALRRQDPFQRTAGRARRRRDLRGGALRRHAGCDRIRSRPSTIPTCATRSTSDLLPKAARGPHRSKPRRCQAAHTDAPVRIGGEYHLAVEHHNPMEMHATTVIWEGDGRITVYDKNQGSQNVQGYLAKVFGFRAKDVRVLNPFVGGAFGSGLRPQYQVYLAVLAAKKLERSVRVSMTRQQMFTHVHRPECLQSVSLASDQEGRLKSIMMTATSAVSRYEAFSETLLDWPVIAYSCENTEFDYAHRRARHSDAGRHARAWRRHRHEPVRDRAGRARLRSRYRSARTAHPQLFGQGRAARPALHEQGADVRLSRGRGALRLEKRSQAPRSMKDGQELVGWGMATGIWEAMMMDGGARDARRQWSSRGRVGDAPISVRAPTR